MNNIKYLLEKNGIVQKQFAMDIGVSQPTVSDWIHNKKDPRGVNLLRVADYFGVSTDVIKGIKPLDGVTINTNTAGQGAPRTSEARILSAGIDRMPTADRQRALAFMKLIFNQYEEYFNDDTNQPTTTIEGIDADVTE